MQSLTATQREERLREGKIGSNAVLSDGVGQYALGIGAHSDDKQKSVVVFTYSFFMVYQN
jgi:hypothetical protein